MATVSYQTLLLGTAALIVTSLLVVGQLITAPTIAEQQAEDLRRSLAQVVPPALHDNDLLMDQATFRYSGEPLTVYRARRQGEVVALAYRLSGPGYAGPIDLVMGVARDGKLLGVRVLSHSETPGLGDKIERAKANWITAFDGRSLTDPPPARWAVKKDGGEFDQFTGATITPRATIAIIKAGLQWFMTQRMALLDELPATSPPSPKEALALAPVALEPAPEAASPEAIPSDAVLAKAAPSKTPLPETAASQESDAATGAAPVRWPRPQPFDPRSWSHEH